MESREGLSFMGRSVTPEEASPGKTDQNNYLDPEASNQFIVAD